MTAPKPTTGRKPIGTIGLLTGAFFAIFAIVFIGMGIRDIRAGDSASPLFFLAWLVLIALVVVYWMKRKKTPAKPKDPRNPPNPFLFTPLFLQDTASGTIPMLSDENATKLLIVLVAAAIVGIVFWLLIRNSNSEGDPYV